jgi:hypothetical protein
VQRAREQLGAFGDPRTGTDDPLVNDQVNPSGADGWD